MKRIASFLVMIIAALCLFSCTPADTTPPPENPPEDGDKVVEYKVLVKPEGSGVNLSSVTSAVSKKSGKTLPVISDANMSIVGEIVFGDSDRTASREAADALRDVISQKGDGDYVGYLIYKDKSGNVAVVWSDGLEDMAIAAFVDSYCNLDVLSAYLPGVLFSDTVDYDDYLYEAKWAKVAKTASPEVLAALKSLAKMFDGPAIADWMANLWEPYICVCGNCAAEGKEIACYGGGFYYSNSARDYEGFLPDMENTAFVLSWIQSRGAFERYGNKYENALPDEIKQKIIKFVQALQDEASGYFYHPQWGSNVNTDRRGRDLSNAISVLNKLGAKPLYPTALDRLNGKTASDLTYPLGRSATLAVASVVKATGAFEDSLKSAETYMAWLKSTTNNMFENTAGAHVINAGKSQIVAAGYLDITLDYLDQKQEELFQEQKKAYDADPVNNPAPTGLWQRTVDYNAVWGLLKFAPFYSDGKREIKYAEYAMRTCVGAIMIDADEGGNYHMNDVYNQWSSASNLIDNAKKYNPDKLSKLYEIANENAVKMIENSIAKLAKFIHEDGTYGYNQGTSAPSLYGTPVSLGVPEGDVNATILASGMYASVFNVLGHELAKMCDWRDGERFIETIMNLGSAEKKPVGNSEKIDFDNNTNGYTTSFQTSGSAEIVGDPKNSANQVLRYQTAPGGNDSVAFNAGGSMTASCFVFEADILVESSSANYFTQIYLGGVYMIDMTISGGKVSLRDNATNTGTSYTTDLKFTAEFGEWFNLRVEYYAVGDKPIIKVYKNGTLTKTSNNFYNSHTGSTPSVVMDKVKFWSMRASDAVIYFDNVKAYRENKSPS